MRICFFGDSFTAGVGDEDGLGWVGRIAREVRKAGGDATAYNLGIRRDTSLDIAGRWKAEALRRFPEKYAKRLVFAFGSNDCARGDTDPRVDPDVSIEALREILSEAQTIAPTLMVGPLPVFDDAEVDQRICELSERYDRVCRVIGVPYVPLAHFALGSAALVAAAKRGDGTHPDGAGYALITERIWAERGVRSFFGRSAF